MKNLIALLTNKKVSQFHSQRGVTMIEYVLIAAVVAGIIIALFITLQGGIEAAFTTINNALNPPQ